MDDKVYITQMELAYKNISNDNVEVNQKAGIMIGIIETFILTYNINIKTRTIIEESNKK